MSTPYSPLSILQSDEDDPNKKFQMKPLPSDSFQSYSSSNPPSDLPNEPQPSFTPPQSPLTNPDTGSSKLLKGLSLADAAARGLDAYSTHRFFQNPTNREMFLPTSLAKSAPAMTGYSEGVSLANYLLSRELEKHGHPRLASLLPLVDIAFDLPYAIHNLTLPMKKSGPAATK
jgi:hypothetical protein